MRSKLALLSLFVCVALISANSSDDSEYGLAIPEDALNRPAVARKNEKNKTLVFGDIPENRCFCTYGHEGGICDKNETCIRHPLAACFHAVELVFNETQKEMVTWHKYGCAPLEKGSDASHLTCNAYKSTHYRPKSIACCYEGNYCNLHVEPPPYKNLYDFDYADDEGDKFMGFSLNPLLNTVAVIAVVSIIIGFSYCMWKRLKGRKNDVKYDLENLEKQPMLGEDSGSGSGSGMSTLNQRTVAQDLTIIKVIGRGRYGEVRKALYRGSFVAVKTFSTTDEESWKNERDVYQTHMLNHENILQFVAADICSEESITRMLLITDYHELGSLFDYLRRDSTFLSLKEALQLAHSTICGLDHLHNALHGTGSRKKPEIAHRDIKSKNIIVKRDGVCCIADFGLAVRFEDGKIIPEPRNIQTGTKRYMAPEILSRKLNTSDFQQFKMADIYSFSLVMWEIMRSIKCVDDAVNSQLTITSTSSDSGLCSSHDSGSSDDRQYASMHLHKSGDEMSTRVHAYEPPFEGMVASDPSFEEMRTLVCDKGQRPPLDPHWRVMQTGTSEVVANRHTLHNMTDLLIDCWHPNPMCRHSALKVKKHLFKLLIELQNPQESSQPLSSGSFKKETDSGFASGGSSKETPQIQTEI